MSAKRAVLSRLNPILIVILTNIGCDNAPNLIEYKDSHEMSRQEHDQIRRAPVVVVATPTKDVPIAHPAFSRWNPRIPMQLHRLDIQVENVLLVTAVFKPRTLPPSLKMTPAPRKPTPETT